MQSEKIRNIKQFFEIQNTVVESNLQIDSFVNVSKFVLKMSFTSKHD